MGVNHLGKHLPHLSASVYPDTFSIFTGVHNLHDFLPEHPAYLKNPQESSEDKWEAVWEARSSSNENYKGGNDGDQVDLQQQTKTE